MIEKSDIRAALCWLTLSVLTCSGTSALAADLRRPPPPPPAPAIPFAGFFIGLGAGYNSVKLDRDIYALGLDSTFNGPLQIANGIAQGPGNPFHDNLTAFAPEVQLGWFGQIAGSSWLWGAKVRYKYLGITSTERGLVIPQTGGFVPTVPGVAPAPLTGNVLIDSFQTRIDHELALLAFIGHSFASTNVYLGAGPALFGTKSDIFRAVGFGNVNGQPTDITGPPVNFSSTKWVWGTAVQIGMTYFFAPTWFIDVNYTYAFTRKFDTNYTAPFVSTSAGLTYIGNAYITTSQRLTTQAVAVSINKAL
jgi:opacity protein-like surface antigen